jgi:RimJ/RimL family protein N-acetyltransferase
VYRIYLGRDPISPSTPSIDETYESELWRPTLWTFTPPDVRGAAFQVWWLFHTAHVFANRDYALLLIRSRGRVVHRSGVYPRYFRFPFMNSRDLQVGDTWTAPDHQGRGLATFALQEIVRRLGQPGRRFWYLTDSENTASCRVAERAGFNLYGIGDRTSPFGMRILGRYRLRHAGEG